MKGSDKFDEFIRDKLSHNPVAYESAYWDQALNQIEAWEKEEEKRPPWIWFFMAFSLLALFLAGQFLPIETKQTIPYIRPYVEAQAGSNPKLALSSDIALQHNHHNQAAKRAGPALDSLKPKAESDANLQMRSAAKKEGIAHRQFSTRTESGQSTLTHSDQQAVSVQTRMENSQVSANKNAIMAASFRMLPFWEQARVWLKRPFLQSGKAPLLAFRPHVHLWLSSGMSYQIQAKPEQGNYQWLPQPVVGVKINVGLSKRLALQSGLFFQQQNLQNLSLTAEATQYDFVFRQQNVAWKPERLYWLQMPLSMTVRLAKRHRLDMGISLAYLLSTKGSLDSQTQTNFGSQPASKEVLYGIVNGLHQWNYSLLAGYHFSISPRMDLSLQYQFGLRDLSQEEVYGPNQLDAFRRVQFSLNYLLW